MLRSHSALFTTSNLTFDIRPRNIPDDFHSIYPNREDFRFDHKMMLHGYQLQQKIILCFNYRSQQDDGLPHLSSYLGIWGWRSSH
jgi:hypothetical protein